jgi:uncharacterized protein YkwD
MRRGTIRLVLLLLAGSIAAPAAIPVLAAPGSGSGAIAVSETTASQYWPDGEECEMVGRINRYRRSKGLGALKLSKTLGAAAEHHSLEMARYNYFSHTMRNGVSWSDNIVNHGYPSSAYRAENLAAGNSGSWNTFVQWRDSSAHNKIMLTSSYKAIGIGRAYSSSSRYGWYWTATFGSATSQSITC